MEHPRKLLEITYYTGNKTGLTSETFHFYAFTEKEVKYANILRKLANKYLNLSILERMKKGE